jgi:hypothetical protein
MATCAACGNTYDKAMTITLYTGESFQFDSFECAIHLLGPTCKRCGVRIIGHGLEANGLLYCCNHCARVEGVDNLEDRADH